MFIEGMEKVIFWDLANMAIKEVQDWNSEPLPTPKNVHIVIHCAVQIQKDYSFHRVFQFKTKACIASC